MNRNRWSPLVVLVAVAMAVSGAFSAYAAGITIPGSSAINVNTGTLDVPGDISITGTLQTSSGTVRLTGNWSNSGTFTANTGTVVFYSSGASTISGTTSFYNLTCTTAAKTLNFEAEIPPNNPRTNVTNNLNFTGSTGVGNLITLARSGGSGSNQWAIYPAGSKGASPGWTVSYVSVSYSVNLNSNYINPDNSTDGGNNTNWFTPTLVELTAFYAIGYFGKVAIYWKTASEYNNAGFNLYVSESKDGPYRKLNSSLIPGLGTSTTGSEYSYTDSNVVNGKTYYYKLEDVEFNGRTKMHGPVVAHPGLDSDGDGMTDDWEIHYGLNPYDPNDAMLDLDGDGLTNLEEFQQGTDPTQSPDGVRIIKSDETGIILELITSNFKAIPKQIDGITYQVLEIPGYEHGYIDEPGKPQMPLKVVPLGIPQGVSCVISNVDFDVVEFSGYNIYPTPTPFLEKGLRLNKIKLDEKINEEFYSTQGGYYPAQIVNIGYEGDMRGQRLVYVNLYPLTFNSIQHDLRFYKRIRVNLQFKATSIEPPIKPPEYSVGYPKVKIYTTQQGLYRLGWDALWNAGFYDISWLDPRTLGLYNKGKEIAIRVVGETDGIFNRYDYIEFYALTNDSKYSKENVYWLTYGETAGMRMENLSSSDGVPAAIADRFLATEHMEHNDFYWGERKGSEDVDRWLWASYIWGGTKVDYQVPLKDVNLLHPEDEARIKVAYFALFNVSHHTLVYLNGKLIDEALWSGQDEHVVDTQVPQSDLLAQANTISIETRLYQGVQYDLLLPNYFEVSYWRNFVADGDVLDFSYKSKEGGVTQFNISGFTKDNLELFDITDSTGIKYIIGFEVAYQSDGLYTLIFKYDFKPDQEKRFFVLTSDKKISADVLKLDSPSSLSSQENKADYIIISYGAFKDNLLALKKMYASKGIKVEIVDVEDIYDEFNYGLESPHAIKDFLRYAYNKWQYPVPTYVLLVGDATYDYRDYLGTGKMNFVPTYLLPDTPYLGETASDNWYVCLDGPDDILADMFIGRIPAGNNSEVKNVVKKILDYDGMARKYLIKKITFASDDEEVFEDISDNLIQYLPKWSTPVKLYLADYADYSQFTQDLINNINNGTLLLNYVGHGSTNLWTEEELFNTSTVDLLTNYRKYPFVSSFTCLDGYFLHTEEQFRSLAEVLLIKRDAGAIGCFSPTGMGLPDGHKMLSEELFKAIFLDDKYRLGPATTQAKLNLFSRTGTQYQDLIHTYTLFGDPALSLKVPRSQRAQSLLRRPVGQEEDEFGEILKKISLNYQKSKRWRSPSKESIRLQDEDFSEGR